MCSDKAPPIKTAKKGTTMKADMTETNKREHEVLIQRLLLAKYQTKPYQLVMWEITTRCNLECIYCYNNCPRESQELSDAELLDVAQQLIDIGVRGVCFTGGEPALRPVVFELAKKLRSKGVKLSMITNGSAVTEDTVDSIVRYFQNVKISLDTLDPMIAQKVNGSRVAVEEAVHALDLLLDQWSAERITIAAVLTRHNTEKAIELIDYAVARGVRLDIGAPLYMGRAIDSHIRPMKEEIRALVEYVKNKSKSGAKVRLESRPNSGGPYWRLKLIDEILRQSWILSDGTVAPDNMILVSLGNVKDQPLKTIWKNYYSNMVYMDIIKRHLSKVKDRYELAKVMNLRERNIVEYIKPGAVDFAKKRFVEKIAPFSPMGSCSESVFIPYKKGCTGFIADAPYSILLYTMIGILGTRTDMSIEDLGKIAEKHLKIKPTEYDEFITALQESDAITLAEKEV